MIKDTQTHTFIYTHTHTQFYFSFSVIQGIADKVVKGKMSTVKEDVSL